MLECFGKSEKENDGLGLAAKAADVEAADLQPVVGIGVGALASCWQSIMATSAAERHGDG